MPAIDKTNWNNPAHPDFLAGFYFECACGEQYREVQAAARCRKCRTYTYFGYCTHVTDTRTGEVVWGEEPTEEQEEQARVAHEQRMEQEREWLKEEEARWEAERQQYFLQKELEAAELAEDQMWDIQERLTVG